MPRSSTITARCAALNTAIAQVIPDICTFARRVRDARHDLNEINSDLLAIRTGLGVAQDDFANLGSLLPTSIVDAWWQVLDSCDDTSERLHKSFLKLSCCVSPKDEWAAFKSGPLVSLRHDLAGSKMVMELAIDYLSLFDQRDILDSFIKNHVVSETTTLKDELLRRTDSDEIHINITARDRLPSLLQAIRLMRSCIAAMSRTGTPVTKTERRTATPRPDSLEPALGEVSRSERIKSGNETPIDESRAQSPLSMLSDSQEQRSQYLKTPDLDYQQSATQQALSVRDSYHIPFSQRNSIQPTIFHRKSIQESIAEQNEPLGDANSEHGTWLDDTQEPPEARTRTPSPAFGDINKELPPRPISSNLEQAHPSGTFLSDDNVSTLPTINIPKLRLRKSRSWCPDHPIHNEPKRKPPVIPHSKYSPHNMPNPLPSLATMDKVDKLAIARSNRKETTVERRIAVDRMLTNIHADATPEDVEEVLLEGANPMVTHPEFGYFHIRAAHEMAPEILQILIDFGGDITPTSIPASKYYSAMHAAALGKRLDTVKFLTSLGHSIDSSNTLGETPLHLAVKTPGAYEIAKYLIDMGADVNHEADDGDAPLQVVLTAGTLEGRERSRIIELLIRNGAEGEVTSPTDMRRGYSKGRSVLGLA